MFNYCINYILFNFNINFIIDEITFEDKIPFISNEQLSKKNQYAIEILEYNYSKY